MQFFRQSSGMTLQVGPVLYTSGATVMSGLTLADIIKAKLIQTNAGTSNNITLTGATGWTHKTRGNYTINVAVLEEVYTSLNG